LRSYRSGWQNCPGLLACFVIGNLYKFTRSDDLLVLTDTVRIRRVNWKILAKEILEVFLNREGYFIDVAVLESSREVVVDCSSVTNK